MRHEITELKKQPATKMQLDIPEELNKRIELLAMRESHRTGSKVPKKDKVLEAILTGIEAIERNERSL